MNNFFKIGTPKDFVRCSALFWVSLLRKWESESGNASEEIWSCWNYPCFAKHSQSSPPLELHGSRLHNTLKAQSFASCRTNICNQARFVKDRSTWYADVFAESRWSWREMWRSLIEIHTGKSIFVSRHNVGRRITEFKKNIQNDKLYYL